MSKGSRESTEHPTDKTVTLTAQNRANYLLRETCGELLGASVPLPHNYPGLPYSK